jgi:hypothetical protein
MLLGLVAAYILSLATAAAQPVRDRFFAKSSVLFPWSHYVWWLPFGIAIWLLARPALPLGAGARSVVVALLFTPVWWGRTEGVMPGFFSVLVFLMYPSPPLLIMLAVTTGVPFYWVWLLSYAVLRRTPDRRVDPRFRPRP